MFANLLTRSRLLTSGAALAALAALALLTGHPTLAKSIGADVWNVPALNDQLRESSDLSAQLDDEDEEIRHRIVVKEAIIGQLIANHATLAETTAKFIELNASRPEYVTTIRATYPGATYEEKAARNVISYALARAPAGGYDALSRRLDAELQQMTDRRTLSPPTPQAELLPATRARPLGRCPSRQR